jgi:hypothetical protein
MGTLAVFAPFGTYQVHHQLDQVLATYLRVAGFRAFAILCDGLYPTCDVLAWLGEGERARIECSNCASSGSSGFAAFGIPVIQMREALNDGDFEEANAWANSLDPAHYAQAEYQGRPIGKWISSSVCSFFRITERQFHQPRVRKAHRQMLINGLLTYRAVSRIFDQAGPTHCSIFNGRMAPYRLALEVSRERGIRTMVHERGWADNTFVTFENRIAIETTPIHECGQDWAGVALTREECVRVKQYFENREVGKDINLTPFVNYATDYAKVRVSLRIPEHARFLLVCTTSEYELGFCDDFQTPLSQLDLIRELIELFRDRKEYLVIRHHPSIGGDSSAPPDFDYLTRSMQLSESLPDNVRVVSPTEQLSTYALFWHASACFAPFSMTGVEAIARGVRAVGFEQSPFREGLTGCFKRGGRRDISDLIEQMLAPDNQIGIEDVRRLYRFLYSFIGRLCVQFQSFGIRDNYNPDIRVRMLEDLTPGRDYELDRIARFFTDNQSLRKIPSADDRARSDRDESDFLQNELRAIAEKRAMIAAHSCSYTESISPIPIAVIGWSGASVGDRWLSSLRTGRHRNIQAHNIREFSFDSLLEHLDVVTAPFCVLRPPDVVAYDQAFLSRAADTLNESLSSGIIAVFTAINLLNARGEVECVCFGQHRPLNVESDFRALLGSGINWKHLIGSMIFTVPQARRVLTLLRGLVSDEERLVALSMIILDGQVKRLPDALVYLRVQ